MTCVNPGRVVDGIWLHGNNSTGSYHIPRETMKCFDKSQFVFFFQFIFVLCRVGRRKTSENKFGFRGNCSGHNEKKAGHLLNNDEPSGQNEDRTTEVWWAGKLAGKLIYFYANQSVDLWNNRQIEWRYSLTCGMSQLVETFSFFFIAFIKLLNVLFDRLEK